MNLFFGGLAGSVVVMTACSRAEASPDPTPLPQREANADPTTNGVIVARCAHGFLHTITQHKTPSPSNVDDPATLRRIAALEEREAELVALQKHNQAVIAKLHEQLRVESQPREAPCERTVADRSTSPANARPETCERGTARSPSPQQQPSRTDTVADESKGATDPLLLENWRLRAALAEREWQLEKARESQQRSPHGGVPAEAESSSTDSGAAPVLDPLRLPSAQSNRQREPPPSKQVHFSEGTVIQTSDSSVPSGRKLKKSAGRSRSAQPRASLRRASISPQRKLRTRDDIDREIASLRAQTVVFRHQTTALQLARLSI